MGLKMIQTYFQTKNNTEENQMHYILNIFTIAYKTFISPEI